MTLDRRAPLTRTPMKRGQARLTTRVPLARGTGTLARTTRLAPKSAKRTAEDRGAWAECKRIVDARDRGECQGAARGVPHRCQGPVHRHHIRPVGEGGARCDPENLISLCTWLHDRCHNVDRDRMAEHGLIARSPNPETANPPNRARPGDGKGMAENGGRRTGNLRVVGEPCPGGDERKGRMDDTADGERLAGPDRPTPGMDHRHRVQGPENGDPAGADRVAGTVRATGPRPRVAATPQRAVAGLHRVDTPPGDSPGPVRLAVLTCQVQFGAETCDRTDYETVDMGDGGTVRLCPRHRSWAAALGTADG